MRRRLTHLITPGDHYSPRTGSAVSTVVHGLSAAGPADGPTPRVLVARGTYPERYTDAEIVEYDARAGRRWDRPVDLAAGRLSLGRPAARRSFAAALSGQGMWDASVVLAHNAVEAVSQVDSRRHVPVLWAHNQLFRTYSQREAARTLGNAAAVVCVSDHLAEATRARLPRSMGSRVVTVRNGVDTDVFRPGRRSAPDGVLDVLFVGRVIPDKGAHVAAAAVARLRRDDIRLTVIGSAGFSAAAAPTRYEQSLRSTLACLGARGVAQPFLPRAEVAHAMSEADVLVVPSVWDEPFALTALEGLAAGCAVVASRAGGIPEAVGDAGVLVRPGDVDELAQMLASLADDRSRLAALKASGREWALHNDWAARNHELREVLEALA